MPETLGRYPWILVTTAAPWSRRGKTWGGPSLKLQQCLHLPPAWQRCKHKWFRGILDAKGAERSEWLEKKRVNKKDAGKCVAWEGRMLLVLVLCRSRGIWGICRSPASHCLLALLSFDYSSNRVWCAWTCSAEWAQLQFHSLSYVRRGSSARLPKRKMWREAKREIFQTQQQQTTTCPSGKKTLPLFRF